MAPSIEEIKNLLIARGFIASDGLSITNEAMFKDLIFCVFLAHISHERVKRFWKQDYLDEMSIPLKHKKIKPFFHLPFHFVGFNKKTVFISDKDFRDNIFHGELISGIVNSFSDIHILRKIGSLPEITDDIIHSGHSCSRGNDEFCSECKLSFTDKLLENHEKFFRTINISSHIVVDIPYELIPLFLSEDDLLEEVEKAICACGKFPLEHHTHCGYCGREKPIIANNSGINREKMLNLLLAIYLGIKSGASSYDANRVFYENSRETDVFLKRGATAFLVEGTTKIDLDKEYILNKGILLLTANALLPTEKHKVLLWSLDKECASQRKKEYVQPIDPHNDFLFIPSNLSTKILANNSISIKQNDLVSLKAEFNNVLDKILEMINTTPI